MATQSTHPYAQIIKSLTDEKKYFCLPELDAERYEAAVRNCDNFEVTEEDVNRILDWQKHAELGNEVAFKPSRVLLQDFTGVPAIVDLAAMRDAIQSLGEKAERVNPLCPTDLVIDHSVSVDSFHHAHAREENETIEFQRNRERFAFLKWGQRAFRNMSVVPPGSGIVHQVNLEYLARVVFTDGEMVYPDSAVGTDSHTTMVDGLGVLAWGVGGIEAEATMLGQPNYMVVPEVVGFELTGTLPDTCTATDLVLKVAQMLRAYKVVGKLVEFYGPGVQSLSVADRATISNMSPEFGTTAAFFPIDEKTMNYLACTGRDPTRLQLVEQYLKANKLFRLYNEDDQKIQYSGAGLSLDLSTLVPAVAGPKRPHDFLPVSEIKTSFKSYLSAPVGFKGYGLSAEQLNKESVLSLHGQDYKLKHGSVVIAAITSCTNTSNPSVMLRAGLVAKKANLLGLKPPAYVKCSLSPGSHVVFDYLVSAGLKEHLEAVNFYLAGFGCQTCIGNSGDLEPEVAEAITANDLVVAGVLSGNRNYEGRIHPLTRANFLASPPLVVAYALAGTVNIDFEREPIGISKDGKEVYFKDIWPTQAETEEAVNTHVTPELFKKAYANVMEGSDKWQKTPVPEGDIYTWDPQSTYVHQPPFFQNMQREPAPVKTIENAYCLLNLGDGITTDHISPAGKIAIDSPAARFLREREVAVKDFNSYGSRRGNDEVMVRGTFANIRLVNKMVKNVGPTTIHIPSGEELAVYDAAERYMKDGDSTIILAGLEYGSGSSRDWAAKGPMLQGVRAVIARSYERIHRSNLVGMGILPLQFKENEDADSLGFNGTERFSIETEGMKAGSIIKVKVTTSDGQEKSFETKSRIDTPVELEYYKHNGILKYVLRKMAGSA